MSEKKRYTSDQKIIIPPLLVFQKVCLLNLNLWKHFVQTFWSPTKNSSRRIPIKTFLQICLQNVFPFKNSRN